MVRTILSIVIGYIALFIFILVTLALASIIMGTEATYKPGVWDTTTAWIVTSLILSVLGALVGGVVCGLIARRGSKAPFAFAAVVIVLGVLSAGSQGMRPDPGPRPAEATAMDGFKNAKQPAWFAWTIPVIGAAGVYAASAAVLRVRKRAPAAA